MLKQELSKCLRQAVLKGQQEGILAPAALPDVVVEHPQNPEHGDFASGLALKLARAMRMSPIAIAQEISDRIALPPQVDRVWVAPPGFINFVLRSDWLGTEVESILAVGELYGDVELGTGMRVQLEFVSVNPTGPLHVGHGRGAVLGSTLANILSASGCSVER
jgi:arginyl-tRNA synthetase